MGTKKSFIPMIKRKLKVWYNTYFHTRENVVMFHHGRCGSTALAHLLQKHPDVSWAGEILEHENNQEKALQKISGFIKNNPSKHCGIEIKPFHLNNCLIRIEDFLSFLSNEHFTHFILLTRKNILRSIISSQISLQTQIWHLHDASGQKLNSIYLNPDKIMMRGSSYDILSLIQKYETEMQDFEVMLSNYHNLRLYYEEDVLSSPYFGYSKICHFIKVQNVKNKISLVRTNPFPVSEMVINFSELASQLHGTPYEWMLHN